MKKFLVGDPCYVIPENLWDEFCEAFWKSENGHFKFRGEDCFSHRTAFGDGVYFDKTDTVTSGFDVDSGMIGVIPASLCPNADGENLVLELEDISGCHFDEGIFYIGSLEIDTDPKSFQCQSCEDEITEYEYNDTALCKWCFSEYGED